MESIILMLDSHTQTNSTIPLNKALNVKCMSGPTSIAWIVLKYEIQPSIVMGHWKIFIIDYRK